MMEMMEERKKETVLLVKVLGYGQTCVCLHSFLREQLAAGNGNDGKVQTALRMRRTFCNNISQLCNCSFHISSCNCLVPVRIMHTLFAVNCPCSTASRPCSSLYAKDSISAPIFCTTSYLLHDTNNIRIELSSHHNAASASWDINYQLWYSWRFLVSPPWPKMLVKSILDGP